MHETFCKIDAKETEIVQLRKTIESLQFDVVSLSSQKDLMEKRMNESSESSTGVVSGLLKKVDTMTTQIRESTAKISSLDQQVSEKNELISSLQTQLHSFQQRLYESESAHVSELAEIQNTMSEESLASNSQITRLEIELSHIRTERELQDARLDAAVKRYETVSVQLQEREDEVRLLQSTMHIDRMSHQNSLAVASQIRVTALTQISRAIQKELSTQFGGLEQRASVKLMDIEAKLSRFQRRVFSFVSTVRVQRKDRAQTQHMQKLLQHHQQELSSSRQTNDDAMSAIRELLEWLRSLRYTGVTDYISVLDNEALFTNGTGGITGVTLSSSKLPNLIRHAKVQLQGVLSAQQELINEQRKSVWEKEMALQETEKKIITAATPSTMPPPRTPNTGASYVFSTDLPGRSMSRERPISVGRGRLTSAASTPMPSARYLKSGTGTGDLGWPEREHERDGSPAAREITRLHTELKNEKARLATLQEQHSDLLSLLAQQELELNAVRDALLTAGGSDAVGRALSKARRTAKSRYGTYVDFREGTNLG